ncbi:hypothetical protein N9K62_02745, partial [Candidatus Pelagibacter bacterium]|nr:hypothetical protein [Candidatus Pelagibacter bacterium]
MCHIKFDYYLKTSAIFFHSNYKKRLQFIKKKKFLFDEISNFINNCIDNSKDVFIFCAGNSVIGKNIKSKKTYIKEISKEYQIKYHPNIEYVEENPKNELKNCDTVIIADIEHQLNLTSNLLNLSKKINDDAKIIIFSKNMVWIILLKILKFFLNFSPNKTNFLPSYYLEN